MRRIYVHNSAGWWETGGRGGVVHQFIEPRGKYLLYHFMRISRECHTMYSVHTMLSHVRRAGFRRDIAYTRSHPSVKCIMAWQHFGEFKQFCCALLASVVLRVSVPLENLLPLQCTLMTPERRHRCRCCRRRQRARVQCEVLRRRGAGEGGRQGMIAQHMKQLPPGQLRANSYVYPQMDKCGAESDSVM